LILMYLNVLNKQKRIQNNYWFFTFYKRLKFEDIGVRDPQYPERTYMKKSIK
jgi:hypothetical protein